MSPRNAVNTTRYAKVKSKSQKEGIEGILVKGIIETQNWELLKVE